MVGMCGKRRDSFPTWIPFDFFSMQHILMLQPNQCFHCRNRWKKARRRAGSIERFWYANHFEALTVATNTVPLLDYASTTIVAFCLRTGGQIFTWAHSPSTIETGR